MPFKRSLNRQRNSKKFKGGMAYDAQGNGFESFIY